jgi:hypothetical protein
MYHNSVFEQLRSKSTSVQERWFQLTVDTYPEDPTKFLQQEKDCLLNPVGSTISQEISILYDELTNDMNMERLSGALDRIIRIRAIQEFLPSQAVSFILLLKRAVREILFSELTDRADLKELAELDSRIDKVSLLAFDIYMACREKVFNIRIAELSTQSENIYRILARANQGYK